MCGGGEGSGIILNYGIILNIEFFVRLKKADNVNLILQYHFGLLPVISSSVLFFVFCFVLFFHINCSWQRDASNY